MQLFDRFLMNSYRCARCSPNTRRRRRRPGPAAVRALVCVCALAVLTVLMLIAPQWLLVIAVLVLLASLACTAWR